MTTSRIWTFFGDSDSNNGWLQGHIFVMQFRFKLIKPALLYCLTTVFIEYRHEYCFYFYENLVSRSRQEYLQNECSHVQFGQELTESDPIYLTKWVFLEYLHEYCTNFYASFFALFAFKMLTKWGLLHWIWTGIDKDSSVLLWCHIFVMWLVVTQIFHLELQPPCSSTLCCCSLSLLMLSYPQTSLVLL